MKNFEILAHDMGVTLSDRMQEQFRLMSALLLEWNNKFNLTTITAPEEIMVKHYLDSLSLAKFLKDARRIVDVGAGAGFPSLPLKIAMPTLKVTMLDSLNKRIAYLNNVIEALDLLNIQALHQRAEDGGRDAVHRDKYCAAVARAVASLPVLCEYCLPFVKIGGYFFAMKGDVGKQELSSGQNAAQCLGGKFVQCHHVNLPGCDSRTIVVFEKIAQTPPKFPRKAGIPSKKPLF